MRLMKLVVIYLVLTYTLKIYKMKKIKTYGVNDLMTIGVEQESKILILQFDVTPSVKNEITDRLQLFIKPEDIKGILKFLNKSIKEMYA